MPGVAVLCWEENRPWISALRQKGYSVPWVEEPKGDVQKQIPAIEPELLIVDMTRLPERGKNMVAILANAGSLKGIPVILVSDKANAAHGLKGKVDNIVVSTPGKILSTVKSFLK